MRLVTIGLGTCNLGLPPGDSGDRSEGLSFPVYLGSDRCSDMLITATINLELKEPSAYVTEHQ